VHSLQVEDDDRVAAARRPALDRDGGAVTVRTAERDVEIAVRDTGGTLYLPADGGLRVVARLLEARRNGVDPPP
jgi:hypothetical protein